MKVTHYTPELMIVDSTPWLIGGALILFILTFAGAGLLLLAEGEALGLLFLLGGGGMGLGGFWAFVRREQVILDRSAGEVVLRRRTVFGQTEERQPLAALRGAVLETLRSRKGGTTFRAELDFGPAGRQPVTGHFTNGPGPARIVQAINDWLDSGRPAA